MLPLVLLLACSAIDADLETNGGVDAIPMTVKPAAPAHLLIATAPDRERARRAPVKVTTAPSDALIVRTECFPNAKRRNRSSPSGSVGSGSTASGPPPTRRPSAKPSPQAAARPERERTTGSSAPKGGEVLMKTPAPPASTAADDGVGSGGLLDAVFGGSRGAEQPASAPMEEAAAEPTPDRAPVDVGGDGKVGGRVDQANSKLEKSKDKKRKVLEALDYYDGTELQAGVEEEEDADRLSDKEALSDEAPRAVLDWGATVYLSNDDSMSLASAQRLLYSMKRQARPDVSEIRPHELLNYFSVDVAPIEDGRLFSVLGGAEQNGDSLTVSLAVRGASPPRKPMDLTMVVDRSGSMREEGRMDYLKRGMTRMTEELQNGDRVDVVLFDSSVCTPLENFVVGRDDMSILQNTIDQMTPRGSTDLDAGLREAYRIHDSRSVAAGTRNSRVMLVTDANLNSGNVNEDLVSEVGRRFDESGMRLTGIGVGRNFNDTMLNKLTEKGKGAYVYLGSEAVVDRVFGTGFDSLTRTIAHDVQFSLELPDSLAMERFYGEESSTNAADVQPIHYYAGTTQLFLQDLAVKNGRANLDDPIRMRIKYRNAETGEPSEEVLQTTIGALIDGDRHNLHKGQALMAFADVATNWAMNADPCGASLTTYRQRVASLTDDAEIGYTNSLVGGLCRVDMAVAVVAGVAYKVRVDSDIPIAEVGLTCSGQRKSERLSGSDTVARFGAVTPGECTVQLQGTVPLTARVTVPETGGDVRCMVRGGRLSCS